MSNEITWQFQLRLGNGGLTDSYSTSGLAATQNTALMIRNVQNIGTAAAGVALDLGSVATPGVAVFVNLDSTNYVEVGENVGGTFYPFVKLLFGEQWGPMRLGLAAPYARANTAAVDLFYIIYND